MRAGAVGDRVVEERDQEVGDGAGEGGAAGHGRGGGFDSHGGMGDRDPLSGMVEDPLDDPIVVAAGAAHERRIEEATQAGRSLAGERSDRGGVAHHRDAAPPQALRL